MYMLRGFKNTGMKKVGEKEINHRSVIIACIE